jgi:hypothetical protein
MVGLMAHAIILSATSEAIDLEIFFPLHGVKISP